MSDDGVIDEIFSTFRAHGAEAYLAEPVTLREHMLQTAQAAERDGAPDRLVAAGLLHDYGHLIHGGPEDAAESGLDTEHEEVGFRFLQEHFPPEVVEPVRLHVDAKRYLCATRPDYYASLSEDSRRSLALQGGTFSAAEAAAFIARPHGADAVAVRQWDDRAKCPGAATPPLAHFVPLLEALAS